MSHKKIVREFYQALCASHDIDDALNYLADDIQWHSSHPINDLQGVEEFLNQYWVPLKSAMPDIEYKPFLMMAGNYNGQIWVDSTGYFVGTFLESLFGIPPTRKTLYLRFGEMLEVKNDKISDAYVILDFLDAMNQADVNPCRPSLGHDGFVLPPSTMDGLDISGSEQEARESMELVEKMHAGLASYDGKSLLSMNQEAFWHPNFMWYGPAGIGTTRGLQGFREHHQGPFLEGFPDRSVDSYVNIIAEGNYVAMGGWPHMSATHSGNNWMGLPASNRSLTIRVMDFWRRENDLLMENWVSIDIIHFLLQMGHDVFADMQNGVTWNG